jgi:hypothetical protein
MCRCVVAKTLWKINVGNCVTSARMSTAADPARFCSPSGAYYMQWAAGPNEEFEWAPGRTSTGYVQYAIKRTVDDAVVATWRAHKSRFRQPYTAFFLVGGDEWAISGTHYMYKLLVDCSTGTVYDDITGEKSSAEGYVALDAKVSPDGPHVLIRECLWGMPDMLYTYDLSRVREHGVASREWADCDDELDAVWDAFPGKRLLCVYDWERGLR